MWDVCVGEGEGGRKGGIEEKGRGRILNGGNS